MMQTTERSTVTIEGIEVPVKTIKEKRDSVRIYLGKREVIIRMPNWLKAKEEKHHKQRLVKWMQDLAKSKKGAFNKYQKTERSKQTAVSNTVKPSTERFTVKVGTLDVPVKMIKEKRDSVRIYLGKEEVLIRMPNWLSAEKEAYHRQRLIQWMHDLAQSKEGAFSKYQNADYTTGDTIRFGGQQYTLLIHEKPIKQSTGQLIDAQIVLQLSSLMDARQRSKAIRTLLNKIMARAYLPQIQARVAVLNERFFKQRVRAVELKYLHARWGSCAVDGVLCFSTRLFFAPEDVIDYVIIHELAHLIEHNHSSRFWALVAKAMPDYKQKEAWLKEHGGDCDF